MHALPVSQRLVLPGVHEQDFPQQGGPLLPRSAQVPPGHGVVVVVVVPFPSLLLVNAAFVAAAFVVAAERVASVPVPVPASISISISVPSPPRPHPHPAPVVLVDVVRGQPPQVLPDDVQDLPGRVVVRPPRSSASLLIPLGGEGGPASSSSPPGKGGRGAPVRGPAAGTAGLAAAVPGGQPAVPGPLGPDDGCAPVRHVHQGWSPSLPQRTRPRADPDRDRRGGAMIRPAEFAGFAVAAAVAAVVPHLPRELLRRRSPGGLPGGE